VSNLENQGSIRWIALTSGLSSCDAAGESNSGLKTRRSLPSGNRRMRSTLGPMSRCRRCDKRTFETLLGHVFRGGHGVGTKNQNGMNGSERTRAKTRLYRGPKKDGPNLYVREIHFPSSEYVDVSL
jgi:hypothetical protein